MAQSIMSTSPPVSDIEQDSKLLKLPPEIKNSVLELSMTTDKPIVLSAVPASTMSGKVLQFRPTLPPVLSVCKRPRTEAPLNCYYANNTFVFLDSMFTPNVLSAFLAVRESSVASMTQIKIFHRPQLCTIFDRCGEVKYDFTIRLTATLLPDARIEISDLKSSSPIMLRSGHRGDDYDEGFCCCFLEDIVQLMSAQHEKRGKLFDFVLRYRDAMGKMSAPDRHSPELYCGKCESIRSVDMTRK